MAQTIAKPPTSSKTPMSRAKALADGGKTDQAITAYRAITAAEPGNGPAWHALGSQLRKAGKTEDAIKAYGKAVAITPQAVSPNYAFATLLKELGRHGEAVALLEPLAPAHPDHYDLNYVLGAVLLEIDRFADALTYLQNAARLRPNEHWVHQVTGSVYRRQGLLDAAISCYRRALQCKPDFIEARWSLAISLLQSGRQAEGWQAYDARWSRDQMAPVRSPHADNLPQWQGEVLGGKRMLLWREQGIGDEVMFAGWVNDMLALGARCAIECEPRLQALFARSFPGQWIVPQTPEPDPNLQKAIFDYQSALGDVPARMARLMPPAAPRPGYLRADPERARRLRQSLVAHGKRIIVGISWRTMAPWRPGDRSAPLEQWGALLKRDDVLFVSLQYGDVKDELAQAKKALGVDILVHPEVDPWQDLDGLAALMTAADLVVSIDNSTVHLAGALGRPAWMLLHHEPDWRWPLEGEQSPYYASLRMVRNGADNDWSKLLGRVSGEIDRLYPTSETPAKPADPSTKPLAAAPPAHPPEILAQIVAALALAGFRGAPDALRVLATGATHYSYLARINGQDAVVRLPVGANAAEAPHRLLNARLAGEWGIGPRILAHDVASSVLVSEAVPGRVLDNAALQDPDVAARMGRCLGKLHGNRPIFAGRVDVFEMLDADQARLSQTGASVPFDFAQTMLAFGPIRNALQSRPVPLVPIHNDAAASNYAEDKDNLRLVDWQFSALGEAAWDLASLVVQTHMPAAAEKAFLEAALAERPPSPALPSGARLLARIRLFKVVCAFHWTLFHLDRHARQGQEQSKISAARWQALTRRLMAEIDVSAEIARL